MHTHSMHAGEHACSPPPSTTIAYNTHTHTHHTDTDTHSLDRPLAYIDEARLGLLNVARLVGPLDVGQLQLTGARGVAQEQLTARLEADGGGVHPKGTHGTHSVRPD